MINYFCDLSGIEKKKACEVNHYFPHFHSKSQFQPPKIYSAALQYCVST